jgi:hypothetical protein
MYIVTFFYLIKFLFEFELCDYKYFLEFHDSVSLNFQKDDIHSDLYIV